jgi:hypothetical protein
MGADLNSRAFSEHLQTTFRVSVPGNLPLPLELFAVTEKGPSQQVEQFSLVFRGPLKTHFPQGTYAVEHEKLGKFDLFLVPLGPDSSGMCYQATFCRMRQPLDHPA